MEIKDKILAILPHSIAGRLIVNSAKKGFEELGYIVDIYDEIYDGDFLAKYKKDDYSYLLSYDFTSINLKIKNNVDIKTINIFGDKIQDPHSGEGWDKLYPELFKADNLSFLWDKDLLKHENNPYMFYLPHFVDTTIYKNLNLDKKFDVMFMGRLDTDYRLKTFENILNNFNSVSYYAILRHFEDAKCRLENEKSKKLITTAYQGFIDNEEDMARAINEAKIVINFNEQGVSSLNYRTIQTMASETLHIGDVRADGIEYFHNDYIYYNNNDEMIDKIKYYLENYSKTLDIKIRIRKIIEKDFSHRAGVNKIIEFARRLNF